MWFPDRNFPQKRIQTYRWHVFKFLRRSENDMNLFIQWKFLLHLDALDVPILASEIFSKAICASIVNFFNARQKIKWKNMSSQSNLHWTTIFYGLKNILRNHNALKIEKDD